MVSVRLGNPDGVDLVAVPGPAKSSSSRTWRSLSHNAKPQLQVVLLCFNIDDL